MDQGWPGRLPSGSGIDHQQSSTHHMPSTEQSHPLSSHQPWNPVDVRQSIPSYPGQQQGYGGDAGPGAFKNSAASAAAAARQRLDGARLHAASTQGSSLPPGFPPEWHPQSAGSVRTSSHDDMVNMLGRMDLGPSDTARHNAPPEAPRQPSTPLSPGTQNTLSRISTSDPVFPRNPSYHGQASAPQPEAQPPPPGLLSSNSGSASLGDIPSLLPGPAGSGGLENPMELPPCHTIYVSNVEPSVGDQQLQEVFEMCGDIRTLYTGRKHEGFVLITYYDGHGGNFAKAAMQSKQLLGRSMHIELSQPGQKVHDKDTQAATVSLYGINDGLPDEALRNQMQTIASGMVVSVTRSRSVPECRLVEFWDMRAAEQALAALNGATPRVPTISEGPSQLPMGLRNSQSSHVINSGKLGTQRGPPCADSSFRPGSWDNTVSPLEQYRAEVERGSAEVLAGMLQQPGGAELASEFLRRSGASSDALHALQAAQSLSQSASSGNMASMASMVQSASHPNLQQHAPGSPIHPDASPRTGLPPSQLHLLQQQQNWDGLRRGAGASLSTGDIAAMYEAASQNLSGGMGPYFPNTSQPQGWGSGLAPQGLAEAGAAWGALQGTQAALRAHQAGFSGLLPSDPLGPGGAQLGPASLARMGRTMSAGAQQQLLQQQRSLGSAPRPSASHLGQGPQRGLPFGRGAGPLGLQGLSGLPMGRGRPDAAGRLTRRTGEHGVDADRRAQQERMYQLDFNKVLSGEDKRTTLMMKNIPNKYTQKMLLAAIDEDFARTYDFFYLPIDFKNKCNVGYAFINLLRPETIAPLAQRFNNKKWPRFNSEKVCHISYARIQGKHALVTHFQNSSLLHEDKRCRPILFHSDGATAGEQEPFPTGSSARGRSHRSDSVTHVDSGSTAASMTNGASRTSLAGISENEDGPSLPQSGPAGSADSLLAA